MPHKTIFTDLITQQQVTNALLAQLVAESKETRIVLIEAATGNDHVKVKIVDKITFIYNRIILALLATIVGLSGTLYGINGGPTSATLKGGDGAAGDGGGLEESGVQVQRR